MNISDIVQPYVAENSDKTAIIFGDRHILYSELNTLINRAAVGLTKLGLGRGDVLSLFLPSLPELIIAYLGAARAGVTVNLINAMLQKTEAAYILNDCNPKAVLVDSKRFPIIESVRREVRDKEWEKE